MERVMELEDKMEAYQESLKKKCEAGTMDEAEYKKRVKRMQLLTDNEIKTIVAAGKAAGSSNKRKIKGEGSGNAKVKKQSRGDDSGAEGEEDSQDEDSGDDDRKPRTSNNKNICTVQVAAGTKFEVLYAQLHQTDPDCLIVAGKGGNVARRKAQLGFGACHYGVAPAAGFRPGGNGSGKGSEPGSITSRSWKDAEGRMVFLARDKEVSTSGKVFIPPGQRWFGYGNFKPSVDLALSSWKLDSSITLSKPPSDGQEEWVYSGYQEYLAFRKQQKQQDGQAANQNLAPKPPSAAGASIHAEYITNTRLIRTNMPLIHVKYTDTPLPNTLP